MTQLSEKRRAIRRLLDEQDPADAMAVHYAFHYPDDKTQMVMYPVDAGPRQAIGFLTFSRTGIDLFRPFVTLRLPIEDVQVSIDLVYSAMQPGANVILQGPASYLPLLQALFKIRVEDHLRVLVLDRNRFEPIINVLVVETKAHNNLPQFVVRRDEGSGNRVVASAGLNWQTPSFAEITVNADPRHRRRGWGRSVVAAMVQHLLATGRTPLYVVREGNEASVRLARSVGFTDPGIHKVMIQGMLKPRP